MSWKNDLPKKVMAEDRDVRGAPCYLLGTVVSPLADGSGPLIISTLDGNVMLTEGMVDRLCRTSHLREGMTVALLRGKDTLIGGQRFFVQEIPGHGDILGRDAGDSHPIIAITGLRGELDDHDGRLKDLEHDMNDADGKVELLTDRVEALETGKADKVHSHTMSDISGLSGLADQVAGIAARGGEANVIETVKRNGTPLAPDANKAVDIAVPEKVSDLTNDSGFQTAGQVQAALEAGLASLLTAETYGPSPVASFDAGTGGLPVRSCRVDTAAGSGSVNVWRTGKNLVAQTQYTASNVVWNGDAATWTVASGTNYAMLRVPAIRLLAGVTYTASCRIKAVSKDPNYAPRIAFRTTAWAIVKQASMGASETEAVVSCTYTPSADTDMYIGIMGTGSPGRGCQLEVSQLQLEVGSSRTDYDPYRGGVWTYDPATGSLTPPVMSSVPGVNCIWSDGGDVTVEYGAFLAALQAEIEAIAGGG